MEISEVETVLVALSGLAFAGTAETRLQKLAGDNDFHLRATGPARWLLVGTSPAQVLMDQVAESCGDAISVVDQSSGRVIIRLSGAPAARVLAKGTAVDLDDTAFPVGSSTPTLFGHIGVQLSRLGANRFELCVMRSYAESLLQDLKTASREFGYVVVAA